MIILTALLLFACTQKSDTTTKTGGPSDSIPLLVGAVSRESDQDEKSNGTGNPDFLVYWKDGSQLRGSPQCGIISVRTTFGGFDVPWKDIRSLDFSAGRDSVKVLLLNGDKLQAILKTSLCKFTTLLGVIAIDAKDILSIDLDAGTNSRSEDLLGYYPFNGNANDESARGQHGSVHGAVLTKDRFGKQNSAYRFDGVDSYISFPSGWIPGNTEGFTVSAWILAEEKTRGIAIYTGAIRGESQIAIDEDGLFFGVDMATNPNTWFKASAQVETGKFIHVVGVYRRGQKIQLWINGELRQETSIPLNDLYHGAKPYIASIGSYSPNHFSFQRAIWLGAVDDVRLYGRALGDDEIRRLYISEK
jgi:hypothetical protein